MHQQLSNNRFIWLKRRVRTRGGEQEHLCHGMSWWCHGVMVVYSKQVNLHGGVLKTSGEQEQLTDPGDQLSTLTVLSLSCHTSIVVLVIGEVFFWRCFYIGAFLFLFPGCFLHWRRNFPNGNKKREKPERCSRASPETRNEPELPQKVFAWKTE